MNALDDFKYMFTLMLTDITRKWFASHLNGIQDIVNLKEKSMKRFNSWGQTLRKQYTYLHTMKSKHSKHDIEWFVYDIN